MLETHSHQYFGSIGQLSQDARPTASEQATYSNSVRTKNPHSNRRRFQAKKAQPIEMIVH